MKSSFGSKSRTAHWKELISARSSCSRRDCSFRFLIRTWWASFMVAKKILKVVSFDPWPKLRPIKLGSRQQGFKIDFSGDQGRDWKDRLSRLQVPTATVE